MKLDIDFNELCDAFSESNAVNHYFIDTKKQEIVHVNGEVDDNFREKLEGLNSERYIKLPRRDAQDALFLMEVFGYELRERNSELADDLLKTLEKEHPFRSFKDFLEKHQKTKKRWFDYKDKEIKNQTINWLCAMNIDLEEKPIPNIKIKEVKNLESIPEGMKNFGPVACLKCHNKKGLKTRFFSVNVEPENRLIEKEIERIMKEDYGIEHFGWFFGEKELLTVSQCPECGSEKLFWDY